MIASGRVVLGDNLDVLRALPDECIDLIYVDPPFNTGRRQTLEQIRSIRDEDNGDRTGFKGQPLSNPAHRHVFLSRPAR